MPDSAPGAGAPSKRRRYYPATPGQPAVQAPVMDDLDRAHAESTARLAEAAAYSEEEMQAVEEAGLAHYRANAERIAANLAADPDATG